MRYNKMHNIITLINNKAQLKVFMSSFTKWPFSLAVFGWSSALL